MKSVFGLDQNLAAALSYLFLWVSGIVVLVMEKENKFVRFHALQSTLWFLLLSVAAWVVRFLGNLPFIGRIFGIVLLPAALVLGLVGFISWIVLVVKANAGKEFKLPIIGDVVWAQVNKA